MYVWTLVEGSLILTSFSSIDFLTNGHYTSYHSIIIIIYTDHHHTTLKPLTGDMNNIDHLFTMQCSAEKPWVLAFTWTSFDMNHPSKHCCGPSTPPHHSNIAQWQWPHPQQDNLPWHTTNTAQEQLEEHSNRPKVLTGPPNSPDLNLIEHPNMCWSRSDTWRPHPQTYRTQRIHYKSSGARRHRTLLSSF